MSEKRCPIQRDWMNKNPKPHPTSISWSLAERAYSVYRDKYGDDQSLERLAQRGGFGVGEMDDFVPGWREEESEIASLRSALLARDLALEVARKALEVVDKLWFDPSDKKRGACSCCDANLHYNCQGKHQQLNGEPCPIQVAHDALRSLPPTTPEIGPKDLEGA